ncbi:MAG TPA: anti-sigma factor [Thermoanaerobaculia bacterium]|nr:anti-sigma factor [Thermoanaerobaculia bacterium]
MTATCPYEELVAAHALGALDAEERAGLERHLAGGCPVCGPELEAMERVAEAIALSPPPVQPRPEVRRQLLERAAAVVPLRRRLTRRSSGAVWAVAASVAVLLLAGALAWGVSLQQRLAREQRARAALAADLATARAQLQHVEGERVTLLRHLAVLGASRLQQVQLAALPPAPTASGRMFVDPGSGKALFSAAGLPRLQPNRTYQLWFIAGGKPVSAGTFDIGASGQGQLLVERAPPPAEVQAWAVTVEPAGGVPQPTGEMVLKS